MFLQVPPQILRSIKYVVKCKFEMICRYNFSHPFLFLLLFFLKRSPNGLHTANRCIGILLWNPALF